MDTLIFSAIIHFCFGLDGKRMKTKTDFDELIITLLFIETE